MRRFIFMMVFLFLGTSSALAQMCASNAGNSPGDIIQTWTDFWDQGVNGFSWEVYINGTPWRDYGGVTDLTASSGCLHQCKPLRFLARTSNVSISNGVTGGNASGWKCTQVVQIVGHDEGPIKAAKKAAAQRNADIFTNLGIFFGGAAVGPCTIIPEPYACAGSMTGLAISTALAFWQTKIVQKDPWDENYLSIYDPPWPSAEELGLSYTNDYSLNQMIGDTQGVVQMTNFILVEVDRYTSCQMANVDCVAYGVDHRAYIEWATWMLGWYLNDIGNNAWTVAWVMEQNGADPELVGNMRYFAQTGNDAGWEFQQ